MNLKIEHDGPLDIALGRSRRELNWKNRQMQWSEIVNKVCTTHRTAETHAEYMAAKKGRQDEIKDVGGFVGGYLANGKRGAGRVSHRQLITLDADYADGSFWDVFTVLFSCAGLIYSTHKHTPDKPRLRLIIPLSREVFADEYEAIARKVAGTMDIELFDPTTFQPERLMYWPSTSKDGEYVFQFQDGPWLDADEILSQYVNWKDSSEWPVSEKVNAIIARGIKKQGDPLEKSGVIGAFCRSYTIHEAIETFLGDIYEPCTVEGRYTYKEGSTAAGLITYDDKFAYSHHGTDPVSGKLCNAFDLVRIHKFGLQDEDAKPGTVSVKLPSFLAMQDLSRKDNRTKNLLISEKLEDAKKDFAGIEIEDVEPEKLDADGNPEWHKYLDVDRKGNIRPTINNVAVILENDVLLKGKFTTDDFRKKKMVTGNLPWRKLTLDAPYVKDQDEQNLIKYLEKVYDISVRANIKDAFDTHLDAFSFHPVRDYLNSLEWDGISRVDTLLIDYLGAEDTPYTRMVTRKTLLGAVARVFHPGIQFDQVLTLVGKQGIGKSTLIKKLGGDWYSDSFGNIQNKEAMENIQGVWIMELGELAGLKKVEVESIKHFITKKDDSFRPAYGRNVVVYKRQCIFIATTNNKDFLRDPTGNRRFWPVDVYVISPGKDLFTELDETVVGQIWAEAMQLYSEDKYLDLPEDLKEYAEKVQEEHSIINDMKGIIEQYLDTLLPVDWDEKTIAERRNFLNYRDDISEVGIMRRTQVCVPEIWCECYKKEKGDMSRNNTKEIHDVMRNMPGWKPAKSNRKFSAYGLQRAYEKIGFGAGNDAIFDDTRVYLEGKKVNTNKHE
jgi:predicted P-loop ATPase